jgi:hypothetical protein
MITLNYSGIANLNTSQVIESTRCLPVCCVFISRFQVTASTVQVLQLRAHVIPGWQPSHN